MIRLYKIRLADVALNRVQRQSDNHKTMSVSSFNVALSIGTKKGFLKEAMFKR